MAYVDVGSKYESEWGRMCKALNLPIPVTEHPHYHVEADRFCQLRQDVHAAQVRAQAQAQQLTRRLGMAVALWDRVFRGAVALNAAPPVIQQAQDALHDARQRLA